MRCCRTLADSFRLMKNHIKKQLRTTRCTFASLRLRTAILRSTTCTACADCRECYYARNHMYMPTIMENCWQCDCKQQLYASMYGAHRNATAVMPVKCTAGITLSNTTSTSMQNS
jgi:hypothetical protein